MAKPTGAVDQDDYGHKIDFTGSNWLYLYFIFPLPIMPSHWCDSPTMKRHKIKMREHVTVAAGDTIYLEWYLLGGDLEDTPLFVNEYSGAIAGAWQTAVTGDVYCDGANFSPYNAAPEDETLPRFVCGYVKMQSAEGGANYLNSVYMQIHNDDTYSAPDPSGGRKVEVIDRNTAANRIYAPYEFASAYEAMRVVSHSLNRFTYENRFGFTLQLFGEYTY